MPVAKGDKFLNRLIKNMKDAERDPVTPLVDEYFMKRDSAPNRLRSYSVDLKSRIRPSGRLSPSSLCGCMRQAAMKFAGVSGQRSIDPDLQEIFDQGDWIHAKWQARFDDMQLVLGEEKVLVVSCEARVKIPELYVAGNSDNVLRLLGEEYVIDYKSINDNGFQYVFRNDEPKYEHVRQLLTYCRGHGVARGLLLYENKNNQKRKVFIIEQDQLIMAEVDEWTEEVIALMEQEKLPPMHPECAAGNYLWEKCQYAYLCYGTKSDSQLRRMMYSNWRGVKSAWRRGNRAIRKFEAENAQV